MGLKLWRNICIIFCVIAGVLLHFAYEWSGQNSVFALIASVNESTWEHLKLTFFPMFFMAIVGYFLFGKNINNYIEANAIGIIAAMVFVTVFFYTYSGIIGENFAVINILGFVLAVILGEFVTYKIIKSGWKFDERLYLAVIGVFVVCFAVFTYFPPQINLFRDPVTNKYGIHRIGGGNG